MGFGLYFCYKLPLKARRGLQSAKANFKLAKLQKNINQRIQRRVQFTRWLCCESALKANLLWLTLHSVQSFLLWISPRKLNYIKNNFILLLRSLRGFGSVLFFISSFFIHSFFIRSFFIISFFIRSFFIHYFFIRSFFIQFIFYTVHFL